MYARLEDDEEDLLREDRGLKELSDALRDEERAGDLERDDLNGDRPNCAVCPLEWLRALCGEKEVCGGWPDLRANRCVRMLDICVVVARCAASNLRQRSTALCSV